MDSWKMIPKTEVHIQVVYFLKWNHSLDAVDKDKMLKQEHFQIIQFIIHSHQSITIVISISFLFTSENCLLNNEDGEDVMSPQTIDIQTVAKSLVVRDKEDDDRILKGAGW